MCDIFICEDFFLKKVYDFFQKGDNLVCEFYFNKMIKIILKTSALIGYLQTLEDQAHTQ